MIKELLSFAAEMVKTIQNLPKDDRSFNQVLIQDLKTVNEENGILRQEIIHWKSNYEKASQKSKTYEFRQGVICRYFQDYLDEASAEDQLGKRYTCLLGLMNSAAPWTSHDLSVIIGSDHNSSSKIRFADQSLSNSGTIGLPILDLSGAHSTESSHHKHKKDKLIKMTRRMRQKCEAFLKKFEDMEEGERLKRLKEIEEKRKANMVKQHSLVVEAPKHRTSLQDMLKVKTHRDATALDQGDKPSVKDKLSTGSTSNQTSNKQILASPTFASSGRRG